MRKVEKLSRLLYCLQGCYNETAESIESNPFLQPDEKSTGKLNIFILRQTLRERIMEQLQIHDTHMVNDWINHLLSIDAISIIINQPFKPTNNTRYRVNTYAIKAQLNLIEKINPHTHTLDQYLPTTSGSPDHQELIKDKPLTV